MSLEDTQAMSAEEVAAILDSSEGERRDGEHPLESPDAVTTPRDESGEEESPARGGMLPLSSEPMHSTDDGERAQPEPGDLEDDQEPEDRAPQPGKTPAPGERPSDSGSTPSDITTDGK
jgi:hypothetical protein